MDRIVTGQIRAKIHPWMLEHGASTRKVLDVEGHRELFKEMRSYVPVEGDLDYHPVVQIVLMEGKDLAMHEHLRTWTCLLYLQPGDPAPPVLIEGHEPIIPKKGMFVVVPPGVSHGIQRSESKTARVSLGMLVPEAKP